MKGERGEPGPSGPRVSDSRCLFLLFHQTQIGLTLTTTCFYVQGLDGQQGITGSQGLVGLPGAKGEKVRRSSSSSMNVFNVSFLCLNKYLTKVLICVCRGDQESLDLM